MLTEELLGTMANTAVAYRNTPDFAIDKVVKWLGRRIVQTSGQDYAIAQHKDDPTDCSDRTEYFDWHSDGLYFPVPPKYVLLHCLDAGHGAAKTELANIHEILLRLHPSSQYVLGKLQSRYVGHGGSYVHPIISLKGMLLASRGVIETLPGLSLNEQPSIREITEVMANLYELLDTMAMPYDWSMGDTLIFNQYQYLHRRNSNVIDKDRKLIRLWFN